MQSPRVRMLLVITMFLLAANTPAHAQAKFITEYQLDRDVIEVPFEYKNHQIIVRGEAEDKKDLTFLFDTGASSPVLEKSLGLTGTHIKDTVIQEAEGVTAAESIWLSKMALNGKEGSTRVTNIAVLLTDLSQMSRLLGVKIDGIVGITYMAGYVTEIDYARRVLRFFDSRRVALSGRKPDNQRTFLFDLSPANPTRVAPSVLLSGKLHEKYDYSFLLDSGYGGYISVAQAAAQESGLFKEGTPRIPSTSYSVSRRFVTNKIRAGFLMLGEVNLSGRIISVDVRNNDTYGQTGIVGNRFLQNYRVILDYQRHKLWLERVTEKEEPDEAEKPSLGITVRADGNSIRVEKIAKNSPAQRAGLRPGDMIVSVNGQSLATLSTAQALNLLASPQGRTTLALVRGVDPNLGTPGEPLNLTLDPSSPLDWKGD